MLPATRTLATIVCFLAALFTSNATIIWSDDFSGRGEGTFPNRDFTGNLTNDWMMQSGDPNMLKISTGLGQPGPSLTFTDASLGAQSVPRLQMTEFAPFSTSDPATPLLRVSFDWQIESFASGAANEAFRFILRANNSQAAGNQLVVGLNRADLSDGDVSVGDLTLYAGSPVGTSNMTPGITSAIGLIPDVGWLPGFDFGQYATAADNDTDDLFYRFVLTYDYTTGLLDGTVTRLALDATNGQSATFTRTMTPGLDFSNTDANDFLLIASTNGVTGVSRFDNFTVESIPEPSSALVSAVGAITLMLRRRPRSA